MREAVKIRRKPAALCLICARLAHPYRQMRLIDKLYQAFDARGADRHFADDLEKAA
jgi:hypothetical protein